MCADRWLSELEQGWGWLDMVTGPGWLEVLFGESEMIVSALGDLGYITGGYLFG